MALIKTAQQLLFKALERADINGHQEAEYNGYSIDGYGYFENDLTKLYEDFKNELNDNLISHSPALILYLKDIQVSLGKILAAHNEKQKYEIYDLHRENFEIFQRNKLGFINHFFNFQKSIIYKAYDDIEQKFSIVSDPALKISVENEPAAPVVNAISDPLPAFSIKLKSNLSRKDLTVLWWLLSECDFIEFESQKHLASFLEENFFYNDGDKDKAEYREMSSIQALLSQLKKEVNVDPAPAQIVLASKLRDRFEGFQNEILEVLEKQKLRDF